MLKLIRHKIHSLFRYRKKITLAALFLFITILMTTYFSGRTIYFLIERYQAALFGNKIETVLADQLNHLLQLRLMTKSEKALTAQGEKAINSMIFQIQRDLDQANNLTLHQKTASPFPIGFSFSRKNPDYILAPELMTEWSTIRSKTDNSLSTFPEMGKNFDVLKEIILHEMNRIGYSSGLYLSFTNTLYYLVRLKVDLFPKLYSIDNEISLKNTLSDKEKSTLLANHKLIIRKITQTLSNLNRQSKPLEEISNVSYLFEKYSLDSSGLPELYSRVDLELTKAIDSILTEMKVSDERMLYWALVGFVIFVGMTSYLSQTGFLRNHFKILVSKFRKLAKGQFTGEPLVEHDDDLGSIAKLYNQILSLMKSKLIKIDYLRNQIGDIDVILEENILEQKKIMVKKNIENDEIIELTKQVSQDLHHDDHDKLAIIMTADKINIELETKTCIESIKSQNDMLQERSAIIIEKLKTILASLEKSRVLVRLMRKIGEKSQLLYINSAVEASVGKEHRSAFLDTVDKIERFSVNSTEAAEEIIIKIGEMEMTTNQLLQVMKIHSQNTSVVSKELNAVHDYFNYISLEVEKNWDIFMNAHDTLNEQTMGINKAIEYLNEVIEIGKETDKYIHNIYNASYKVNGAATVIDSILKGLEYD